MHTLASVVTIPQIQISNIAVPNIYSYYQIGNTLDIKLREKSDLSFISFIEKTDKTDVIIDATDVPPGVYSL